MVDKSKLSADLWLRMVWVPQASTDPDDRLIALVVDRKRFWISAIPMTLGLLAAYRYPRGGQSGYYEVREDGSLGDFLGSQIPAALKGMRPTKR
ncbi:MAG TPA: hypothetical protein VF990_00795 [Candidatus Dormibacteraeota bacterium]